MLAAVNERPIAAGLFRTAPELRLIGARSRKSGQFVFPSPGDSELFESVDLPSRGLLWSYTVQRYAPKSPPYRADEPFTPFAVGYIELSGALIVESRLVDVPFDQLRVGLPMELTTFTLRSDPDGKILMFAFRPQSGAPS
jgi:uncharacterized OB-fold protein